MKIKTIVMEEEFASFPAGRLRTEGKYSGEAFREDILIPALQQNDIVIIDIRNTPCCGSFRNEVFNNLFLKIKYENKTKFQSKVPLLNRIILLTPYYIMIKDMWDDLGKEICQIR